MVTIQNVMGFMKKNFGKFYYTSFTLRKDYDGNPNIYVHADCHDYNKKYKQLIDYVNTFYVFKIIKPDIGVPRIVILDFINVTKKGQEVNNNETMVE